MKGVQQKQDRLKRSALGKVRKNAVSKKLALVIPVHGMDELKARIGAPFEPIDFRQLIAQAKQRNPENVDQAFQDITRETTVQQLNELLSGMRINPKDKNAYQEAFATLAFALL